MEVVKIITQLKKGALEMCVLALLDGQDRYGYELVSLLSEEIDVALGTIYPLLKRIKSDGYVQTHTVDSPDGPSRKYYRLTDKGREVMAQSVREWTAFTQKIDRIIGKRRSDNEEG
jgi:PadR family transcriptional regulator PadR